MHDRQYLASLVIFTGAAAGTLTGIVLFLLWLDWRGAVALLTLVGVILAWFYWGPRPDRAAGHPGGGPDRAERE